MRLVPSRQFSIETPLAPQEVYEQLNEATEPLRAFRSPSPASSFLGEVGTSTFLLMHALGYRNSFAPQLRGSFSSGMSGSIIDVRLRLHPFVDVFVGIWLSGAAAFFVVLMGAAAFGASV